MPKKKRVLVCTDTRVSILETDLNTREAFLQYIATKENNVWMHLVSDAKDAGLVTDDDIILLWQEGVLALEHIKGVVDDSRLVSLLEIAESINHRDAYFIFQQWLYRAETFPFSSETLHRWFKGASFFDGKLQSLMTIALHRTSPELLSVDEVLERLESITTCEPGSHGIHRLLFLAIEMMGDDVERQSSVMQALVDCAAHLYFHDRFIYDLFVETLNEHPSWYRTVREIGRQNLRQTLEAAAAEIQKSIANM